MATILVSIIIFGLVGLDIWYLFRKKGKTGCSGCSGGCSHCGSEKSCSGCGELESKQ